jgi:hypothetical protein
LYNASEGVTHNNKVVGLKKVEFGVTIGLGAFGNVLSKHKSTKRVASQAKRRLMKCTSILRRKVAIK